MMSPALRLPSLRILAKQTNVEVTATPSLKIDLLDKEHSITNVNDLLSFVQDSHLWITRSGACRIQISVAVSGRPVLESARLESIAEAVSSCEVSKQPEQQLHSTLTRFYRFGIVWEFISTTTDHVRSGCQDSSLSPSSIPISHQFW